MEDQPHCPETASNWDAFGNGGERLTLVSCLGILRSDIGSSETCSAFPRSACLRPDAVAPEPGRFLLLHGLEEVRVLPHFPGDGGR